MIRTYLIIYGFSAWVILMAFMLVYVIVGPKRFKTVLQGFLVGLPLTIYILGKMFATRYLGDMIRLAIGALLFPPEWILELLSNPF
jgi:hypothetical protein